MGFEILSFSGNKAYRGCDYDMAIGCAAQGHAALIDRVGIVAVREQVNEFLALRPVHLVFVGDCLAEV